MASRKQRRRAASILRRKPVMRKLAEELMAKVDDAEYMVMLEDDNETLVRKNAELENTVVPMLAELPALHAEQKKTSLLVRKLRAVQDKQIDLERLPENLVDVLQLAQRLYGAMLVITPRAQESADVAGMNDVPAGVGVAWRVIRAMAVHLLPLYLQSTSDIPGRFEALSGFELATGESSATRHDRWMRALRRVPHEHGALDMSPHVKYGSNPPKLLRVHFAFCPSCAALVIAHFGDHLETAGTRRRNT